MAPAQQRRLDATSYHVAWICAVADLELIPALLMLDELHDSPDIDNQYDDNSYKFGTMAGHNVVVATCPDAMTGQVNVGHIVGPLFKTFTAIRMTLLVGIGGGVPQKHLFSQPLKDVRLGDVVVGWPSHADVKPPVIYYDSGRSLVDGFQTTMHLNRPHMVLLKALPFLRTDHVLGKSKFHIYLERLQQHEELGYQFKHPGLEHDLLFKSAYEHAGGYNSYCVDCDRTNLVEREPRLESQKGKFIFHQGRIATGNSVIQDGKRRDEINAQHDDVLCIDMEAAGVDINSSCLVIRGISDYADSHKSDKWRSYAAGKAVVFARELLGKIPPREVKEKMAGNKHWLVNRTTNSHFTGRREIINTIIKRLTSEDAGNEQRRFVLTGMGGLGKSEVCLHVANKVRDRFWGIFWVDVSKGSTAEENFSEVAKALGCEKGIDAVRKKLSNSECTKDWLLILDNADDVDTDYQIYLPSGNRGAILITSRNSQCGQLATADGHEELASLEEFECMQLFQKTAQMQEAASETQEFACAVSLVQQLGYHTLAILHAGSYIATTSYSAEEYLEFLRTNRRRLLEKSRGQGQPRYDTVYATFGASIEFLETSKVGLSEETRNDALQLLDVLSTLHYTRVPLEILVNAWEGAKKALTVSKECQMNSGELTSWHVAQIPGFLKTEKGDMRFRIVEALTRLESLALVRTEQSSRAWKSVSMHPLVHGWAADRHGQQESKGILRMTECIVALSNLGNSGSRPYHPQLKLHLKRMVESDVDIIDDAAQSISVLQICLPIVLLYHATGLIKEVCEFTDRIFRRLDLHDREPTKELQDLYLVRAVCISTDGSHPSEAVRILEAIARLDEEQPSEDPWDRIGHLRHLGVAYEINGQKKEAVALLGKVVTECQELQVGNEHPELLIAQYSLAKALRTDGQVKEAISLLENVVKIHQRLLQADDPARLVSQSELARAYLADGQIAEATPILEEVVRIQAQTLGERGVSTILTRNSLADAYRLAGRLSEATSLYERVVNERKIALGEEHRGATNAQSHIADAYWQSGRLSEAVALYEQVVKIKMIDLGEEHPDLLSSQHTLALAFLDTGGVQKAINILERLVDVEKSILEEEDPGLRESQCELGRAYLNDGRVPEAIKVLERLVDVEISEYEEEDPGLLESQYELGRAYLKDGRVVEAITILRHVADLENLLYEQGRPEKVRSQDLLREAYFLRNRSHISPTTLSASGDTRSVTAEQSVEASTPTDTNDGISSEAEGQGAEISRDPTDGVLSHKSGVV